MVTMYVGKAIDDYYLGSYRVDSEYTTNHHGQLWDMNQTKNCFLSMCHPPCMMHPFTLVANL